MTVSAGSRDTSYSIEPMLLAVLSRRFEAICREMTNG